MELHNVKFSSGRIVSDNFVASALKKKGAKTQTGLEKILSNIFGSGTFKATVDSKPYDINNKSAYKVISGSGNKDLTLKAFLKLNSEEKGAMLDKAFEIKIISGNFEQGPSASILEDYKKNSFTSSPTLLSLPKPPGAPPVELLSKEEAEALLMKYQVLSEAPGRNNKTCGELILLSFENGLPMLKNSDVNDDFKQQLQIVLTLIRDEKKPEEQKRLMRTLTEGFRDCQPAMQRTVSGMAAELCHFEADFSNQIQLKFQEFKDQQLEELILQRHPNAFTAGDHQPDQQMPHLKSGYLVTIGNEFGLSGTAEAQFDANKNTSIGFDSEEIKKEYLEKLNQNFHLFINDLSNFYSAPSSYEGRSTLVKMQEWVNSFDDLDILPNEFGYYSDEKKNLGVYEEMTREVTEDHKEGAKYPYISPAEVKLMLETMGFATPK